MAVPISSIQHTEVPTTQAQPISTITTHPESSQAAPRIDKGKGIATKSDEDSSKKLVPASTIVRLDPHEERSVETEFPAIVFNNNLTSDETLSCEPT
nr:hypothetical protein [Tanacetum cinerariifolium]